MTFAEFSEGQTVLLGTTFLIALVMGAVVNKTNFCTMGAVSDMVNMGDLGRMRAWLLAIAVAVLGVVLLEAAGLVDPGDAFPPYRAGQLLWAEHLLGGLMFGIGMTLASGCGNKTLIRIGGGNLKSVVVLAIIALIAYFMVNPFPGSDQTLMSLLFYDWIRPLAVNVGPAQDLGTLVAGNAAGIGRLVIGLAISAGLLYFVFRSREFRSSPDNVFGGAVVGLAVVAAWLVTSSIHVNVDGDLMTLRDYVQNWDFLADSAAGKPADSRPLSPQSFTFINPMGQTLGYVASRFSGAEVTFGVMALLGVVAGSLLWAVLSRGFRVEWFADRRDLLNHVVGAVLMGFGGVLGMGCTIGQGITGISTLALGGFITFGAIVLGSALTMKVQLYRMVYEGEASFLGALVTALADLRLLPTRLRRFDPV